MDEQAFLTLYEATSGSIWTYVARVAQHSDVADDILQETFYRFMLSGRTELELSAARPYLFRIATNLLNDRWRQQDHTSLLSDELPASNSSSDEMLDAGRMLGAIKPRERQLLWLAYVEGMNHREIARVTGLNALSVRVLLLRARRQATRVLSPAGDTDEH